MNRRPTLCFDAKLCVWLLLTAGCHESSADSPPAPAADASSDASDTTSPAKSASDASSMDGGDAGSSSLLDARTTQTQPDGQVARSNDPLPPSPDGGPQQSASDAGATCTGCLDHQSCDQASQRCVDKYQPFSLDCASLPSNGTCQGGPREVLLAHNKYGRVLMFDPSDGHFLGHFKDETIGLGDFNTSGYRLATQGPDQCIWTVFNASGTSGSEDQKKRAIERWNSDGTFRDHVIPRGKHYRDGTADRLEESLTLGFTATDVYVSADDRVSRFTHTGDYVDERLQYGTSALLIARDGSLLVNKSGVTLVQGTVERNLLSEVNVGQLWYAGQGQLLVAGGSGASFKLDIGTRMATEWQPLDGEAFGVAQLRNGQYLITGDDSQVATLDPAAVPKGTFKPVGLETQGTSFGYIGPVGRACLSEAFVQARAPKPALPASECAAPSGPALFEEHFESGQFVDRNYGGFRALEVPMTTVSITEGALRIDGGDDHSDAVTHSFADLRPSYVGYRFKVENPLQWSGYFRLQDGNVWTELGFAFGADGNVVGAGTNFDHPIQADTWVQVQFREIDWQRRTYDLYIDCERVADDVALHGEKLNRLALYNYSPAAVSDFDDIVIK